MKTKILSICVITFSLVVISCNQQVNETPKNKADKEKKVEPYIGKPMNGFPASRESQVTLGNWTTQPYNKWAFRNPGILPSLMVPREGNIYNFPSDLDENIEKIKLPNSNKTVLEALIDDDTDGIIVIKDGTIKYEKYFGDFKRNNLHIWASSTKSLIGMCVGILVERGRLSLSEKIEYYAPEMKSSAFGGLTVQQVLNMVSALNYSEEYADLRPGTVHYEYFRRIGLTPAFDLMALDPKLDDTPRGNMRFVAQIKTASTKTPGEVFEYHSPNVDVIGLIISRVSGQSLEEFISENIWSRIGAEHDAQFMADSDFNPIATGGFNSTLRDFAKFGYAVLNDGKINKKQVFPKDFIDFTFQLSESEYQAGQKSDYRIDSEANSYDKYLSGYKNFWWVHDSDNQIMMARGVFGQGIYIDKSRNVIIAFFGSAKSASNATRETSKVKTDALVTIANNVYKK